MRSTRVAWLSGCEAELLKCSSLSLSSTRFCFRVLCLCVAFVLGSCPGGMCCAVRLRGADDARGGLRLGRACVVVCSGDGAARLGVGRCSLQRVRPL